ncbi:MAG: tetratricopeptide repeat protein [Alphaproteobacteria bacterium]|nr:tetratricopeptide repeat protein [Alphaproteobacteria bacterium]
MVCVCVAGGRLSQNIHERLAEAARVQAQGDLGTAAGLYHKILSLSPHEPTALQRLGVIAQQTGKSELALQLIDAALTAVPDFTEARFNRSVVLRGMGRSAEALQCIRKTVASAPTCAEAWDLLGQMLKEEGDCDGAATCFAHAIGLQPQNARFHGNYALLLFATGNLLAAYREARAADALDPAYPPLLLGNILQAWGHPERAIAYFARARALLPHLGEVTISEAIARLQIGDMERGWELWEKRPDLLEAELKDIPLWRGQKVAHLLLYEEQGLGDALQFSRYIPLLASRAERLTLRVKPALQRLFALNFPSLDVICEEDPPPKAEARCRLFSLPFLFAARLNNIQGHPYLIAPKVSPKQRHSLSPHLGGEGQGEGGRGEYQPAPPAPLPPSGGRGAFPSPRIGLVWAGNVKHHDDAKRSMDFSLLQPLLACGAAHFVSLQKNRCDAIGAAGVFDAAQHAQDLADTAAMMTELDLIISVDTSVAHLAGALGKPVFILLPFSCDWRWLLGREDCPWYASARLFRQKKAGDWESVIGAVAAEVKKFIAGDRSVLIPAKWEGECLRENPDALALPA